MFLCNVCTLSDCSDTKDIGKTWLSDDPLEQMRTNHLTVQLSKEEWISFVKNIW